MRDDGNDVRVRKQAKNNIKSKDKLILWSYCQGPVVPPERIFFFLGTEARNSSEAFDT